MNRLYIRRHLLVCFLRSEVDVSSFCKQADEVAKGSPLGRATPDAFNSKAYRRLATTGPIRGLQKLPIDIAMSDFKRLIHDFVEGASYSDLQVADPSDYALRVSLWGFASKSPLPGTIARGNFQRLVFREDGHFKEDYCMHRLYQEMREVDVDEGIIDDIADSQVESHPSSYEHRRAKFLQDFLQNACPVRHPNADLVDGLKR